MTKNELRRVRSVLDIRQTELEELIHNREGLTIEASGDELDRIQYSIEREISIGNLERDSVLLRDVRAALRRIDTDKFGLCLNCGEEIGSKRLRAVPWTPSCIACQEAEDRASPGPWNVAEMAVVNAA